MISVSYEVMSIMQFQSLLVLLPSFWQEEEEAEYISECILAPQYIDWATEPFFAFDLTRLISVLYQQCHVPHYV
jgi:hypothetical protein